MAQYYCDKPFVDYNKYVKQKNDPPQPLEVIER